MTVITDQPYRSVQHRARCILVELSRLFRDTSERAAADNNFVISVKVNVQTIQQIRALFAEAGFSPSEWACGELWAIPVGIGPRLDDGVLAFGMGTWDKDTADITDLFEKANAPIP